MEFKMWLYVLSLEDNKYYIGVTHDLNIRFGNHIEGDGAAYTEKFKPVMYFQAVREICGEEFVREAIAKSTNDVVVNAFTDDI